MNTLNVKPKGVKIDLAKGEIQLTFSAVLTAENQEHADALTNYIEKEAPRGTLEFLPQQPMLFQKEIKPEKVEVS